MASTVDDKPSIKTVFGPGLASRQAIARVEVPTTGRGMVDISGLVDRWLTSVQAVEGLLTVFLRHTSASLAVQENADPSASADLMDAYDRLVPMDWNWRHSLDGPADMAAHVKSALTGVNLAIPVVHGRADLGTWQGIFVVEHRLEGHRRDVTLHYLGT
ncbi:secondary thiamine-phosphate synthase enzyme [Pseudoxanthobacter soli DSM 19599]|uniref:Secondary thiamine-phosphate synthase enzyme n=1 Tax=Pseudoxanthobacter soli DSM 19599 TaxID=1123029 RepID=A0A1M7ZFF7_9HYPH|nr:secondary thiamine-phosphate synthase enzyme YjbQ [Pseudoxanthobacter soli]SHO63617.1 secondary thiamine-phosphate synthase enzyme [Pseudoxanthobacter soli DSM 19599]